jgi:flavin reductase (DIM6/NTAB) family NADH-FMN oxidoreductase RutF
MERHITDNNPLSQALRKITYGFYIVTSKHEDDVAASTMCWVSQVSFEPPMVMVSVKNNSKLQEVIQKSKKFAVNIVGKAGKPMLRPFMKETNEENGKINDYKYQEGQSGIPVFKDLPALFECEVREVSNPGDHTVFIGEVIHTDVQNEMAEPLITWETDLRYGG